MMESKMADKKSLSDTLSDMGFDLFSAARIAALGEHGNGRDKDETPKVYTYRILLQTDIPSAVKDALSAFGDGLYSLRVECGVIAVNDRFLIAYDVEGIAKFFLPLNHITAVIRCESDQ